MNITKKGLIAVAAAALLVFGVAAPAQASPPLDTGGSTDVCTSTDAWTETIQHEAIGEPTLTVENPDYVAESSSTEFDHWQRYSWTGGPWESNTVAPDFPSDDWQANVAGDPHGVGVAGAYYRSHGNKGNGDWFYLKAVMTTVTIPAVGEPTMTVSNPDYVAAWTETIEHDAIECAPVEEPPVPPVTPPTDTLAETGFDPMPVGLAGLALLLSGGTALAIRKLSHRA